MIKTILDFSLIILLLIQAATGYRKSTLTKQIYNEMGIHDAAGKKDIDKVLRDRANALSVEKVIENRVLHRKQSLPKTAELLKKYSTIRKLYTAFWLLTVLLVIFDVIVRIRA